MKITAMMENTACRPELDSEHGLSLFIEAEGKKLVFDFGDSGKFADNAAKLGIDPGAADAAVLSHGHYDHGGGMERFFQVNTQAPVYVHRAAFENHAAKRGDGSLENIGIDPALLDSGRIILTGEVYIINKHFTLFSDVSGHECVSETNKVLLEETENGFVPDSFRHEQNLLISENGKIVLISGCAHRGIINVINRGTELAGRCPDVVIGGFHLSNPGGSVKNMYIPVEETARRLLEYTAKYYTCHCTGAESYAAMRDVMGDRLEYLTGGMTLEIGD